MQALGARSTLLAACLSRPQPLRLASRSGRTFKSTWTAPVAAAPPRASSGGKPSAGAATVQQRRTAASSSSTDALQLPRVILKGGKSKLFTDSQSPMVYSGAVDRVLGRPAPKAGDTVLVCDGAEKTIGWGVYNPESMFRVRIMQLAEECFGGSRMQAPDLRALVSSRIQQAVALRAALGLHCGQTAQATQQQAQEKQAQQVQQTQQTTVFRLLNSEGDRLSGLIVDVLGDHLVVSSSAAWVEQQREAVCAALRQHTGLTSIVWRPSVEMLKEEGCPPAEQPEAVAAADMDAVTTAGAAAAADSASSGSGDGSDGGGAAPAPVVVTENGLKFLASPLGQKTGFYADQRDSRAVIRQLAAGRSVLDMCCFSGGFALSAAAGGASTALGVDSSAAVVELAGRNAELNGLQGVASFVRGDVVDFMKQALAEGRRWDMVVFDPPKLAPSRKTLDKATRKYRRLNAMAMQLVEPGGLLMTCSCSGAMSQSGTFVPMLQAAARDAGRRVTVLREAGAAPDHTLDPAYPEGRYLTNVLLRVL